MLVQPNRQLVHEYCKELNSIVDPDKFFEYYEQRNWEIGGRPVEDWQALFRSWDRREFTKPLKKSAIKHHYGDDPVCIEDLEKFMRGN